MALLVGIAFVAGIVTAISPCVLPVLPIVFAGGASGGKRRPYAIVAGIVASFTAFTLAATALLSALGLPNDLLRSIAIGVVIAMGLWLLLPRLGALLERPFRALGRRRPGEVGGGFLLGISLGLLYTPCAGPVIAAVATVAATERFTVSAVFVTLAYALGSGVVLLALAVAARRGFDFAPVPNRRHAYVTDSGSGELVTLDVERGRVVHRADLGGPARHVSIAPNGRTLWTALGNKAEAIAVVDTSVAPRPRLLDLIRPPYLAHDVVFTPNGSRVWVTSGAEGTIGVYRARSRQLRFTLAADAAPQHIVFGDGVAYVASGDDGTMRVHGLHGGRLVHTERIPFGSYNVTGFFGEGLRNRLFTPSLSHGTLCILDDRGRTVRQVQVASAAHDAAFVVAA